MFIHREIRFQYLFKIFPILKVLHKSCIGHNSEENELIQKDASEIVGEQNVQTSCDNHHIYLALILLLIFSEDEFFCKIIHETVRFVLTKMQCKIN